MGDDFSCDCGSTIYREARTMARKAARENPDKEVRIVTCTTADDFAKDIEYIQLGKISEGIYSLEMN